MNEEEDHWVVQGRISIEMKNNLSFLLYRNYTIAPIETTKDVVVTLYFSRFINLPRVSTNYKKNLTSNYLFSNRYMII